MQSKKTLEDYLKTIAQLQKNGKVRAIDIANYKNVSKPTVSVLLKDLEKGGYIIITENRSISLTKKGTDIAECVLERYDFFVPFLIQIGIDEKTSSEVACELEHSIHGNTFSAFKKYVNSRR